MKQKKQGFTLVELMVVVIIVGILAAVAVPLMTANKDKAISTELLAGLGSVDTAARLYYVEHSTNAANVAAMETAGYIKDGELTGSYFTHDNVETVANAIGYSTDGKGLDDGSGTAKGITATKASGKYTTAGSYTP